MLTGDSAPESMDAFAELFGLEVPTRYSEETHRLFNRIMAVDSAVTPFITGMSRTTVWFCRGLALLVAFTSLPNATLKLRNRLAIEVAVGLAIILFGLSSRSRLPFLERAYFIIGGLIMIANAGMTQTEP